MIIFISIIALLGITVILILNNKTQKETFEKQEKIKFYNWIKTLIIINICVMCFFRFLYPGATSYSSFTIYSIISLLINIIILVFNKKFIGKKLVSICIIILYFLLMLTLPVYKFENHEHVFDYPKTNNANILKRDSKTALDIFEESKSFISLSEEKIIEYVDYYNCYGIKLYRKIK